MNFIDLLVKNKYLEALDYATDNYENLNTKEIKLLKRMLLFCGIDYVSKHKDIKYKSKSNNPFFSTNNRLQLIKALLDSSRDIFLYLYSKINDEEYIEKELIKYKEIFQDINFNKRNSYLLHNSFYEDGFIMKKKFLNLKNVEILQKKILKYFTNKDLSSYLFNEARSRIVFRGNKDIQELNEIKKLINYDKIKKLILKNTNLKTECDYIQLELLEKTPVQNDGIETWHVDNLSDQIKVFIPLVNVTNNTAPMKCIPKSHNPNNLNSIILNYLHYAFKFSSVHTRLNNNFSNNIIEYFNEKPYSFIAKQGDIAIFNTSLLHTGSRVKSKNKYRLNLVLIFDNMKTNKNILLKQLKTFY